MRATVWGGGPEVELSGVCLAAGLWGAQGAAEAVAKPAKAPSTQELKLMSTFLSNFTELGFYDFDVKKSGGDDAMHLGNPSEPNLIRFGVMHNYVNNFKTRIKKCPTKDCEHGIVVPMSRTKKANKGSAVKLFSMIF